VNKANSPSDPTSPPWTEIEGEHVNGESRQQNSETMRKKVKEKEKLGIRPNPIRA
jgi:hypothetical protein